MMQQQQQHAPPSDANAKTELWLGDLAPWMDETYIQTLFPSTDVAAAKLMRNKQTGQSEQYAFLTCTSQDAAQRILDTYNGVVMPGTTDQVFRLNWAAYGVGRTTNLIEFSLFVGDVAPDVTDYTLQETFRQYFPSVRSAKVMTDPQTGKSRGYGFVRFGDEAERDRALVQMNGQLLSNRNIRVSLATAKKSNTMATAYSGGSIGSFNGATPTGTIGLSPGDLDPSITTLFIGGLSSNVSESELRMLFAPFGEIIYVKIPPGKGCGFVQYTERAQAERAMAAMHGQVIGNGAVRISWGRASNRPPTLNGSAYGANGTFAAGYGATGGGMYGAATAAVQAAYDNASAAVYGAAAHHNGAAAAAAGYAAALPANYQAAALMAAQNGGATAIGYHPGGVPAAMPSSAPVGFKGSGLALGTLGALGMTAQQVQARAGGNGVGPDDPLAQCANDSLNGAYVANHQPTLLGSRLFA